MVSGHGEWFADESIWKDLYLFHFPESAFAIADEQVEKILRLTGVGGGKVLDLCCGPRATCSGAREARLGRDRGRPHVVPGRACPARAAKANLSIEFVLEDMRQFSRPATFDLIINFFTSFGYLKTMRTISACCSSFAKTSDPVALSCAKWSVRNVSLEGSRRRRPRPSCQMETSCSSDMKSVDDWTRVRNRLTLMRSGSTRTFEFIHRIYSGQEMKNLLMKAGLAGAQVYEDLAGSSYGLDAQRLIAVARRSV
jgi:hypothetical protein